MFVKFIRENVYASFMLTILPFEIQTQFQSKKGTEFLIMLNLLA